MNYTIEYFHARVLTEIESWPDGVLADYARILELLMEFGTPEHEIKVARKRLKEIKHG